MKQNTTLISLIGVDDKEVRRQIVEALAEKIVPQLRTLIQNEARAIVERNEAGSPFAANATERLIITELAGFLALTDLDSTEDAVLPEQMTGRHVRWWLTPPE